MKYIISLKEKIEKQEFTKDKFRSGLGMLHGGGQNLYLIQIVDKIKYRWICFKWSGDLLKLATHNKSYAGYEKPIIHLNEADFTYWQSDYKSFGIYEYYCQECYNL